MRILVAHPFCSFLKLMRKQLEPEFEVRCCWDGEAALAELNDFRPDGLILHMGLPRKDGITLLKQTLYKPPVILAIVDLYDTSAAAKLQNLGVTGMLVMPTLRSASATLIRQLQECPTLLPVQPYPCILRDLGFLPADPGFRQLCLAAELLRKDMDMSFSQELYPAIAEALGCTSDQAVEKAVRKAIKVAWLAGDPDLWQQYFPTGKRPTNRAFLMTTLQPYRDWEMQSHTVLRNGTVHG